MSKNGYDYIFAYPHDGRLFEVHRYRDGTVTATISDDAGNQGRMVIPAEQWRNLIAALALEPDLWPGADCDCAIKTAQAEVGKPHGGALS